MLIKEEIKNYTLNKHKDIERINCITGKENHIYTQLKEAMDRAVSIDIIVSFVRETGVSLIQSDLKKAREKSKRVRILTGNYLNITQPTALYLLKDILGEETEIRFYSDKSRSFHPKAYIFHYENGEGDIFIGSSNISKMALTRGLEWNYRIERSKARNDFDTYVNEFENLFNNESIVVDEAELKRYSKNWVRPKIDNDIIERENISDIEDESKIVDIFKPRGAQIEALYELNKKREEAWDKALVVAATGVGKTYLAAFDSRDYEKVLFVAHRIEILEQAQKTFATVRKNKAGFFMNSFKDTNSEIIFAGVQTLGKDKYLNEEYFHPEYFDYIVIDETHHIVAKNYRKIIEYFRPKFLLGLTATPDRMDNKDVYSLFDYNVAYEVNLHQAINRGWLVPFRYYGIYDESVDYKTIEHKNGRYNESQLVRALKNPDRAHLVLKHYKKFRSTNALGFCSNREHAEFMARFFNENGVRACAVYSGSHGEYALGRKEAIEKLRNEEINIIFSVDMFNEGVDIKSVDMVLFLRPTESPTVFLQQLGRGLRKDGKKKYLNVLDFIGNYKKVELIPILLKGKKYIEKGEGFIPSEEEMPEGCLVDFDIKAIDIMNEFRKRNTKIEELIDQDIRRIKNELGYRPNRLELFNYMDDAIYAKMKSNKKNNVLKDYLNSMNSKEMLNEAEKKLLGTQAHEFLKIIEETSMSKSYKMPVLLAFYNDGNVRMKIDSKDIYESFRDYYNKGSNGSDLKKHKSTMNYKSWGEKQYYSLAKNNPLKFLEKSGKGFFFKDGEKFCIKEELREFIKDEVFIEHFKDIIDYRSAEYYKTRYENDYSK